MVSIEVDEDEFAKLIRKMNTPRVVIDNDTCDKATIIKVDCSNKHGMLLEAVQVVSDLNLIVTKAYISSDKNWFMNVFYVTDRGGNKLWDEEAISHITTTLESDACFAPKLGKSFGILPSNEYTAIELTGNDRPGLLSEICAVLANKKCHVVKGDLWTNNTRVAAIINVSDEVTGLAIEDRKRLFAIQELLCNVLKGDNNPRTANMSVSTGFTHTERRLHQMMSDGRDYDIIAMHSDDDNKTKPEINVIDCVEKVYTVVILRSNDRPKLFFDTVCALTDMQYVVFHGTVHTGDGQAYQEYYIRHMDGLPVSSEAEKQHLIKCLEAAIQRRTTEGLELELRADDRIGLLSEVTRIFRENGLSIRRAEISSLEGKVVDTFYFSNMSGKAVETTTIESIQMQLKKAIIRVKQNPHRPSKPPKMAGVNRFHFGNLFKASFQSFRLVRSYT